jgi:hypothetical protein
MGALQDMPNDEKCFIVVRGIPTAFYTNLRNGPDAFDNAEKSARIKTESTGEMHTILCVPRESLKFSVTAVNQGVVFYATDEIDDDE